MSDDKNKQDPDRPKRIAKIAGDLSDLFDEQQKFHANKAQEYGYSRDVLRGIAKEICNVSDSPTFFSAEMAFNKFKLFAKAKEQEIKKLDFDVSTTTFALSTTVVASSNLSSFHGTLGYQKRLNYPKLPPSWAPDRRASYGTKLGKIDPELMKLFRAIWQSFYGSSDNPERIALGCMRQLYDHFFEILAPDCEVRNSPYFAVKVLSPTLFDTDSAGIIDS